MLLITIIALTLLLHEHVSQLLASPLNHLLFLLLVLLLVRLVATELTGVVFMLLLLVQVLAVAVLHAVSSGLAIKVVLGAHQQMRS